MTNRTHRTRSPQQGDHGSPLADGSGISHSVPARSGPIVVKVGGAPLEDPAVAPALLEAIADLHLEHDGGVALVHGGGRAVDRQLEKLGMVAERREGIRITPPEQLDQIVGVLAGIMNKRLVGEFLRLNIGAVGLCLGDADAVPTRKAAGFSFDPGRVGEPIPIEPGRGVDRTNLFSTLLRERFLPVISSIGIDFQGEFLNVNADDAAAGVAQTVGASSLVLLTDVPGVLDGGKRVIPELDRARIDALIASGVIAGGMVPKVKAAAEVAARSGVPVVIMAAAGGSELVQLARMSGAGASGGPHPGTRILPG